MRLHPLLGIFGISTQLDEFGFVILLPSVKASHWQFLGWNFTIHQLLSSYFFKTIFFKNTLKTLMVEMVWFLFKYSEHLCQRQIQTVLNILYYSHMHCPCEKHRTSEAAVTPQICPVTSHHIVSLC